MLLALSRCFLHTIGCLEAYVLLSTQMPSYISDFGGYAYDAVWSFALALSSLNKENPSYLRDVHSNQSIK